MPWLTIDTAPKDKMIVCRGASGYGNDPKDDWQVLQWKHNSRFEAAHKENKFMNYAEDYFGDPEQLDDYELALFGNGPTHWYPIDQFID